MPPPRDSVLNMSHEPAGLVLHASECKAKAQDRGKTSRTIAHPTPAIAQRLPVEILVNVWVYADGWSRYYFLHVCSWWRRVFLENNSHPIIRKNNLRVMLPLHTENRIERFIFRTVYTTLDPFIAYIDVRVPFDRGLSPKFISRLVAYRNPPFAHWLPLIVDRCPNLKILHIGNVDPENSCIVLGAPLLDEHFLQFLTKRSSTLAAFGFFYLEPTSSEEKYSQAFWRIVKGVIPDLARWDKGFIENAHGTMFSARRRSIYANCLEWPEACGYLRSW